MSLTEVPYSKSRVEVDWSCPRKRYWSYGYGGQGLTTSNTSIELFMGTVLHDGLAALAHGVSIEDISTTAQKEIFSTLTKDIVGLEEEVLFAHEQAALVEGLLRGFAKTAWPALRATYPDIICLEEEIEYHHDGCVFMARPDLVLGNNDSTVYVEYKSTSNKKDSWINSWSTAVQLHSSVAALRQAKGIEVDQIIVQGLYKGFECLSPETPVLTTSLKWVTVGSLKVDDKLVGFEEDSGNNRSGGKSLREWREAKVTHVGRDVLPSYELLLEDGTTFTCSENHLWLTAYEYEGMGSATWKKTKDLSTKSRIVKIFEPWDGTEFDPYDAGYLAAAFDGEGCLSYMNFDQQGRFYSSLGLQFTQNPNQMLSYMKELLTKYGVKWRENGRGGDRKSKDLQIYGKIKVLELLGKIQPKRLIPKLDFNRLGMIKDLPSRPVRVAEKKYVGLREVVTLGTSTETLIADGFATHNSYDKQNSPFCYSYQRKGTPPFSTDEVSYEYKSGFRKYPTWEMDGGVRKWVESMPDSVLSAQFPQTPPIFVKWDLVEHFFRQRAAREMDINSALIQIQSSPDADHSLILDSVFPQKFSECSPGWGRGCGYKNLCFGPTTVDPFALGYVWKDKSPHEQKLVEESGV